MDIFVNDNGDAHVTEGTVNIKWNEGYKPYYNLGNLKLLILRMR